MVGVKVALLDWARQARIAIRGAFGVVLLLIVPNVELRRGRLFGVGAQVQGVTIGTIISHRRSGTVGGKIEHVVVLRNGNIFAFSALFLAAPTGMRLVGLALDEMGQGE